jgi:hypothetical protein
MQGIGGDYLTDERVVHMRTSHLYGEIGSQSSGAAHEGNDSFCFADEVFDFPPTVYPAREVFSFGLFVLTITTFLIWGGWCLFSLILRALT